MRIIKNVTRTSVWVMVLSTSILSLHAVAALPIGSQLPGAQQQRSIETERRKKQDERLLEKKKTPEKPTVDTQQVEPAKPEVSDITGPRFALKAINFTDSDVFSDEELSEYSKSYVDRDVTFSELQKLVAELNAKYYERGFITAQAVIPAQKLTSGVLNINLIEGHVGKIELQGNDATKRSYIVNRIGQEPGDLFELQPLQDSLLYFNKTNDVQLTSELQPGEKFGETDIRVEAYEPRTFVIELFGDNSGSTSTGEERGGINVEHKSLFGYRDSLRVSATGSKGSREKSISYSVPVNTKGGQLAFYYYDSDINIVHGALSNLNVGGGSTLRQYDFSQPIFINELWKIDGLAQVQDRHSYTDVDYEKIISSEIVNPSLGFSVEKEDESGIWFSSINFHRFRAKSGRHAYYSKTRLAVARTQALTDQFSGYFNFSGQYTNDNLLPSSEQFQIGGSASVRGYPEGQLIGDKGYYINAEVSSSLPMIQSESFATKNSLQGFLFVDHGGVFSDIPTETETQSDFLTSSGFGLRLAVSEHITANAAVAWGINDHQDQQEPRLHLRVSVYPVGR
ncbi:ShlB/FhaC/HecB family hemolysin secretion/activation protein [Alkalimarinus sediminis]|uniref:BamA/TamA family outer membrane protein n=1 Tax=Alkalimarinus sediminis TaxID=1632866 RepID=A0A9E8KPL0_9ALTE|nr:ShlB/FhaC/HecB family hemolysin secretion/activation protein [Alkalimarinus sediminis]UZW74839.1 BamA/TamA family outer membrane protein [Alkalimarinus sediminis]